MTPTSGRGLPSPSLKSWVLGTTPCAIEHDRADTSRARVASLRTNNRNAGLGLVYWSARVEKAHGHGAAGIDMLTKNGARGGCVEAAFPGLNKTIVGPLNCNVPSSWLSGGT